MKRLMVHFLACLVLVGSAGAFAAPLRLDDSLTHTVPPNVQMRWREVQASRDGTAEMEAWVRVNVRIDTRPIANQSGRIYLVLARDQGATMEASWTSQGKLQSGRIASGERTLVYTGVVPGGTLEDQFLMHLRSPADWQGESRRLQFHFEFDAD